MIEKALYLPLFIRAISLLIMTLFVIPKAYREATIHDSLIRLRRSIFIGIMAMYLLGLGIAELVALRIFHILDGSPLVIITMVNSIFFLVMSIVSALIYNMRYKE